MNRKAMLLTLSWLSASLLFGAPALAQTAGQAPAAVCKPAQQVVPGLPPAQAQGAAPPPRDLAIAAIPGVVAGGANWTKVWQAGGNSADGLLPDSKGDLLLAQEDFDTVLRLDQGGKTAVAVADAKGLGAMSMDHQGRLYGAHRTERPGSTKPDKDAIVNAITVLAPDRKVLADRWTDGTPLTVRPNDLAADGQGGAYFTSGCLYYASPRGAAVAGENLRTNGIVLSADDKTLYVTNGGGIVAFDVTGPGALANRRDFAALPAGAGGGDGIVFDSAGRLYVTALAGVYVFDRAGAYLGLIPTPRAVISLAFAGPDKKTLYVVGGSAEDAAGQPIRQGPQQTAATIYRLPMIAQGLQGRAK